MILSFIRNNLKVHEISNQNLMNSSVYGTCNKTVVISGVESRHSAFEYLIEEFWLTVIAAETISRVLMG